MKIKLMFAALALLSFGTLGAHACDLGYTDYCYGSSYDESAWRWE